jgi:hypothetical protein
METFKEFTSKNESLSIATRNKMKAAARKNKAKIMLGKKKAAKKLASPDQLKKRAEKQAKNLIIKKILKNKTKADLGFAQRASLEKQVAKKQGAIKKIAKKLFPSVKQADRDKLKKQKAEQSVLDKMGK